MKLPQTEIERAASQGDIRVYMNYVHFDVDGKRIVASNGHILAVVPVEVEEGDTSGPIPAAAFKAARKAAGSHIDPSMKANGAVILQDGSTLPRPSADDIGPFPNWQTIMDRFKPSGISVTFNAELLLDLARAITTKGRYGRVITLHLAAEEPGKSAMKIEGANGAFGLLMPCRK